MLQRPRPLGLCWILVVGTVLIGCPGDDDDDTVGDDDDTTHDDDDDHTPNDDDDPPPEDDAPAHSDDDDDPTPTDDDDTTPADDDDDDSGDDDDDSAGDDDDDTTEDDPYIQPAIYVTPLTLVPGGTATVHYHGDLAQEDDLTMHYGFNGWNEVTGIADMIEVGDHGDTAYYKRAEMTPVIDGFEVTVDLPTDGRAMHFVFFTLDEDENETWDNNGTDDYHQSIAFPYIGPYLTWNDAARPDNGVVISYVTSVPCKGTVEYGTTPSLGTVVVGDDVEQTHHFELTGLAPDTEHHYVIRDSAGHESAAHSFRTAPLFATTFTFAALSDMQDVGEHNRWPDTVAELQGHTDVSFLVIPGDLTAGDGPGNWWTFFDRARDFFPGVVMMPVPGNHDTPTGGHNPDTSSFLEYFDLPTTAGLDAVYRFDYGSAAFLGLNSEELPQFAIGADQYLWMEDALLDIVTAGDRAWVFALWHVPPYNAGLRHNEDQGAVRDMTGLFDGVVDWVFSGHEHMYQRTHPLQFNGQIALSGLYGLGVDDGVGYLVMPPAGQPPGHEIYPDDHPDADRNDRLAYPTFGEGENIVDSQNGFVIVEIDAATLTFETWGYGSYAEPQTAAVVDTISYTK